MRKWIILLFLFYVSVTASDIGVTYITVGGGYPLGLLNGLNSQFDDAFYQMNSAFGYTGAKETLTKTYSGGSFSTNIGFGKKECVDISVKNLNWFLMLGYAVHGTGKAKWSSTFSDGNNNYEVSVSGRYTMHDIRLLPVIWSAYGESYSPRSYGIGAGCVYSIVKYSQSTENNVPNSFQLPDVSSQSSGFSWHVYGFWKFSELIGVEAAASGKNWLYVGLFICGVLLNN